MEYYYPTDWVFITPEESIQFGYRVASPWAWMSCWTSWTGELGRTGSLPAAPRSWKPPSAPMLYLAPDLTVSYSITEHIKYGCTCYHRFRYMFSSSSQA